MGQTTEPPVEQGVIIANILPVLRGMPEALQDHQVRAAKGNAAAAALADLGEAQEKITEEMDTECKNMIIKLNTTDEKFKAIRTPFTQMIGEIVKGFTGSEALLKTSIPRLQAIRNRRAKEVVEENKRRQEEADRVAAKNKEKADLVGFFSKSIATCLNNKLDERKKLLTTNFNAMTLADIDERGEKLKTLFNLFPGHKLAEIVVLPVMPSARAHTIDEMKAIYDGVYKAYDFDAFYTLYQNECDQAKQALVDRLPSKLAELKEAERQRLEAIRLEQEAETLRQQQAEQRKQNDLRQAELNRQAADAKNKEDAERIKRQQEEEKQREILRQEEDARRKDELEKQQEQQRIENEKLQQQQEARRQAEVQKLEDERLARDKQASDVADQAKTTMIAQSLFDQSNVANMKEAEGETRKGWEIIVLGPAGWAEIFQYWFLNAMADAYTKNADKVGAVSLDKMKAFCEKAADKTKIESEFLEYRETVVAVNRKDKKGA